SPHDTTPVAAFARTRANDGMSGRWHAFGWVACFRRDSGRTMAIEPARRKHGPVQGTHSKAVERWAMLLGNTRSNHAFAVTVQEQVRAKSRRKHATRPLIVVQAARLHLLIPCRRAARTTGPLGARCHAGEPPALRGCASAKRNRDSP